jgi:4-hydroxybenzoate polyprenyltransferase
VEDPTARNAGRIASALVGVSVVCFFAGLVVDGLWWLGVVAAVVALVLGIWSWALGSRAGRTALIALASVVFWLGLLVLAIVNADWQ